MTEEPKMRLYAAVFSAWREIDGEVTLQVTPGIVLARSEEAARKEGMGGAFAAFPTSEEWKEHQVTVLEIPDGLTVEGYQLRWRIDKIL